MPRRTSEDHDVGPALSDCLLLLTSACLHVFIVVADASKWNVYRRRRSDYDCISRKHRFRRGFVQRAIHRTRAVTTGSWRECVPFPAPRVRRRCGPRVEDPRHGVQGRNGRNLIRTPSRDMHVKDCAGAKHIQSSQLPDSHAPNTATTPTTITTTTTATTTTTTATARACENGDGDDDDDDDAGLTMLVAF